MRGINNRVMEARMNIRNLLFSVLVTTLAGSISYARGGIGDGGGQGIVCRNDDGTVASAKLLDLVEAEDYFLLQIQPEAADRPYLEIARDYAAILDDAIPFGVPTSRWTTTEKKTVIQVGYELSPQLFLAKKNHQLSIRPQMDWIDGHKMLIPGEDYKIPPVGDSHPRVLPSSKNCNVEQIAIYTDGDNQIHFVGSIWNHLNNVNKAALLIHETLYRTLRLVGGETTSDRTRKTVAYLFGGMNFQWILDGAPAKYLMCWTSDGSNQFVVYPGGSTSVIAQFLVFNSEIMLSKTTTNLPLAPFAGAWGTSSSVDNEVIWNRVQNPLLDAQTFEFRIQASPGPLAISGGVALTTVGQDNSKPIICNHHLSAVTYGADGSVQIGSSH